MSSLDTDTPNEFLISNESFFENFKNYKNNEELYDNWISSNVTQTQFTSNLKYPIAWSLLEPYKLSNFETLPDINEPLLENKQCLAVIGVGSPAMIGHKLEHPIKMDANEDLIVQYELKLQKELNCGGGFIKLYGHLNNKNDLFQYRGQHSKQMPLQILFGPDKCIPDINKVRFEMGKLNPKSGDMEIKQLVQSPITQFGVDFKTHLYTLILHNQGENQFFEIRIDGKVVKYGNVFEKGMFEPGFTGPRYIDDPNDFKPDNWVDEEYIDDPNDSKPDDWDETEPYKIVDPDDFKPADWDETIPEYIVDTKRPKPEWWDDSIDGEWKPYMILNPECLKKKGCGKWKPKMKLNPKFKGVWQPRKILNPDYIGEWKPQRILDPNSYEDITPCQVKDSIDGIVFDFVSGSNDMLIDNIYLGKSLEEAERVGNLTFVPKRIKEDLLYEYEMNMKGNIKKPKLPPTQGMIDDQDRNIFDDVVDFIIDRVMKGGEMIEEYGHGGNGSIFLIIISSILLGLGIHYLANNMSKPTARQVEREVPRQREMQKPQPKPKEEDEYEEEVEVIYTEAFVDADGRFSIISSNSSCSSSNSSI
ncbi:hypothetical protein TBLA_0F01810 [Henningerozyma blattae CBS 6284]|uniref:Calreticulin n=1 Tax=Henningerozyma blattae (strain ATCC 34711 / CBS 6284 / DSM 70876 / NBRC 10599 / NRRL Y-10934 / UCD 77-7) TaxID=1071380 RepID=I2H5S1_HENB6|nr:hypothetical protein TBLA_0F01810 [Tetrapisispora blattae CBS 6284]CCH61723.1 hypothetical protein TBLA_0F01810 [Tetrapisispora blattae CBS 6284]